MDPDVEFTSLIQESEAKVYCGHAGVRQFLDEMLSVFPDWTPEVETTEAFGDTVLVKVRFLGTGAGSGMSIEQVGWQVARGRDGKVVGWRVYRTEEEARAALSEAEARRRRRGRARAARYPPPPPMSASAPDGAAELQAPRRACRSA